MTPFILQIGRPGISVIDGDLQKVVTSKMSFQVGSSNSTVRKVASATSTSLIRGDHQEDMGGGGGGGSTDAFSSRNGDPKANVGQINQNEPTS